MGELPKVIALGSSTSYVCVHYKVRYSNQHLYAATNLKQATTYLENNNKGQSHRQHGPELFGQLVGSVRPRRLSVVLIPSYRKTFKCVASSNSTFKHGHDCGVSPADLHRVAQVELVQGFTALLEVAHVEEGQRVVNEAMHGALLAVLVLVDHPWDEVRGEGDDKSLIKKRRMKREEGSGVMTKTELMVSKGLSPCCHLC